MTGAKPWWVRVAPGVILRSEATKDRFRAKAVNLWWNPGGDNLQPTAPKSVCYDADCGPSSRR